jgi:IMP and pyridine-specific 5'-nucleotidase
MKSMLSHSFVLDCLTDTGPDTFSHFEVLIDEHRRLEMEGSSRPSRLKQLVPTVGTFHTRLPLRQAFQVYNDKHCLTKRKHIQISFNEIRHILNIAQAIAMRYPDGRGEGNPIPEEEFSTELEDDGEIKEDTIEPGQLRGPKMITFDGDQTLYTDGSNFDSNPRLANYLYLLLRHGVSVAVVTAAGYEYNVEKYEFRLSGLLEYFKSKKLTQEECERFYLFGGECNYLLHLGDDFRLHPVKETGRGGWMTATKHLPDSPANWSEEELIALLDTAHEAVTESMEEQNIRGRVIRKKRSVGLVPSSGTSIPREALDETVLRSIMKLSAMNGHAGPNLPFCSFNGGSDAWVDVGNKRVAVEILSSYLGVNSAEILHIGDQFLNTGNDFAARAICPCIWITSPEETTYILKTILRLAGIDYKLDNEKEAKAILAGKPPGQKESAKAVDFNEMERRTKAVQEMDVYTGEIKK